MKCSSWPSKSKRYTCVGARNRMALDESMNISKTNECEDLCKRKNGRGCCYLGADTGCHWKPGGYSFKQDANKEIAKSINCFLSKRY